MHDLNDMLLFTQVVRAKSFSGAARTLGISKSRVSKSIARLESAHAVRLLHRSTRQLSLTEVGEAYYEHCERIAEEILLAENTLTRLRLEPCGNLKICATVAFGTLHVAPALSDFMAEYPDISVDMTVTDRPQDLVEERYDLSLCITCKPESNLVARNLAPIRRIICASPDYLERRGIPQVPQDLRQHNCLDYTHMNSPGMWLLKGTQGEISIPVKGTLRINDDEALSQAVLGGLGLALLPTFIVGKELQAGRLRQVLPGYCPAEQSVFAVYLANRHLPLKVRVFIDFLSKRFGQNPYWDKLETTKT